MKELDRSLTERERDAILGGACARNLPAEVVLAGADGKAPLRSRLLEAGGLDPEAPLVIEAPTRQGVRVALHLDEALSVVFIFGGQKFGFEAVVAKRSTMSLGDGVEVPTLALAYPVKVYKLQRRRFFRVAIPGVKPLVVQCVVRDGSRAKAGEDMIRFETVARDISSGGISLKIPAQYVKLAPAGRRMALVFNLEGYRRSIKLIAEVRHVRRIPNGDHIAGMQFVEWHRTLAGRKAINLITRYVVRRQRTELKKKSGLE